MVNIREHNRIKVPAGEVCTTRVNLRVISLEIQIQDVPVNEYRQALIVMPGKDEDILKRHLYLNYGCLDCWNKVVPGNWAFPPKSHDRRREKAEVWCQPSGNLIPRNQKELSQSANNLSEPPCRIQYLKQ